MVNLIFDPYAQFHQESEVVRNKIILIQSWCTAFPRRSNHLWESGLLLQTEGLWDTVKTRV